MFAKNLAEMLSKLVDYTEPICQKLDKTKAQMLIYDTTGIESYVAENNPKFPRTKAGEPVEFGSATAASNPAAKQQYINGHFCYAQKVGILTNGLGIVRHLELFDEDFKQCHPEMQIEKRANQPEIDKEIGDSTSLQPMITDFFTAHPNFSYNT